MLIMFLVSHVIENFKQIAVTAIQSLKIVLVDSRIDYIKLINKILSC